MSIYDRKFYGTLGYYEFKKRRVSFSRVKFFDTKDEAKKFNEITGKNASIFQCKLLKKYRKKKNVLKIRFGLFNNAYISLTPILYKYENFQWFAIDGNSIAERFMKTYEDELCSELIILKKEMPL